MSWSDVEWITAYLDTQGMFGEVNGLYTDDDMLAYWIDNHDTDPSLMQYDTANEWMCDTVVFMDEIEMPVVK